jgi:hypothetical protein
LTAVSVSFMSTPWVCPPGRETLRVSTMPAERNLRETATIMKLGVRNRADHESAGINRHGEGDERALHRRGERPHGGPESCVGVREGVGEALAGVRAGRAIEPRNLQFGVPTLFMKRKATSPVTLCASRRGTLRGRRTRACTESSCARTGRAHHLPVQLIVGRVAQGTLRR